MQPVTIREKLETIRAYDNALNPWEDDFITSMEGRGPDRGYYSDRMKEIIDKIYRKICILFVRTGVRVD